MQRQGTFVERRTFPQLPWGTLKEPVNSIPTSNGNAILVDGWYRHVRKPHYTADIVQALCWCLVCGQASKLAYWYVCFFVVMIIHRAYRDNLACSKKHGAQWQKYTRTVPYCFIPYIA